MAVEGFIFYPSYMEAAECLEPEDRLAFLSGLIRYGLTGEMPDFSGPMMGIFVIAKRNIDASNEARKNGSVGGYKKGASIGGFKKGAIEAPYKKGALRSPPVKDIDIDMNIDMNMDKDIDMNMNGDGNGDKPPSRAPTDESEVVQFADNVTMTNGEHQKLLDTYGPADTALMIRKLDDYKAATGKTYKSDYRAILSWVVAWLKEEQARSAPSGKQKQTFSGGTDATAAIDNKAAREMREILERMRAEEAAQ